VSVYERLEALNIALPKLTPPVAAFGPFLRGRRPGSYRWLEFAYLARDAFGLGDSSERTH
jgi:hypothetical protein